MLLHTTGILGISAVVGVSVEDAGQMWLRARNKAYASSMAREPPAAKAPPWV